MLGNIAFAQFDISKALTASTIFPDVEITCIGNLSVFFFLSVEGKTSGQDGCKGSKVIEERDGCIRTSPLDTDVIMMSNHTRDLWAERLMGDGYIVP